MKKAYYNNNKYDDGTNIYSINLIREIGSLSSHIEEGLLKEYSSYYKQNHDSGEELQFESFSIEAYCGTYKTLLQFNLKLV